MPQGWTGTVTPSLSGYTFTPASSSYSNVAANQTQNYTATAVAPTTFQVSGTVSLNGAGLSGVSLAATGGVSCTASNASGQYGCTVPQGWTGTVTPSLSGYTLHAGLAQLQQRDGRSDRAGLRRPRTTDTVWVEDAVPAGATAAGEADEAGTG